MSGWLLSTWRPLRLIVAVGSQRRWADEESSRSRCRILSSSLVIPDLDAKLPVRTARRARGTNGVGPSATKSTALDGVA